MKNFILSLLLVLTPVFSGSFSYSPSRTLTLDPVVVTIPFKDIGYKNLNISVSILVSYTENPKVGGSEEYSSFRSAVEFYVRREIVNFLLNQNQLSADSLYSVKMELVPILEKIVLEKKNTLLTKYLDKGSIETNLMISSIYLNDLGTPVFTPKSYPSW